MVCLLLCPVDVAELICIRELIAPLRGLIRASRRSISSLLCANLSMLTTTSYDDIRVTVVMMTHAISTRVSTTYSNCHTPAAAIYADTPLALTL